MPITVKFWGVRGSVPSPGEHTKKYGGNTSCVEVLTGNARIIFDAGTGIRLLGQSLSPSQPVEAALFFTHYHWDHLQGFPFFRPIFIKNNVFHLYGPNSVVGNLRENLTRQMTPPNFPVKIDMLPSKLEFLDCAEGVPVEYKGVKITGRHLNHPNGVFAYRLDYEGKSIVFATDTEHYPDKMDESLLAISRNTDILIYDAQYTTDEYEGKDGVSRKGWGHSTMEHGVDIAKSAGVKQLILFHHDPNHDDNQIIDIETRAKALFGNVIAAFEGLEVRI